MAKKQETRFGSNLRAYRKNCGLSQDQVAAKLQLLGFSVLRETYVKYELGTATVPASELVALSKLFHVPIQCFFEGIEVE